VKLMLNDKVVVVTGGARLIGRGFVRRILDQGAIAVVADVNKQAGNDFLGNWILESRKLELSLWGWI